MRKLFLAVLIVCFLSGVTSTVMAEYDGSGYAPPKKEEAEKIDKLMEMLKDKLSICPKTKMAKSCLTCHQSPGFELKPKNELLQFHNLNPTAGKWIHENGEDVLYYQLESINSDAIFDFFQYANRHKAKRVIIEIYSPGGSLISAWRIVGQMNMWKNRGLIIETRCHGFAASAGFLIFSAGSLDHRFVSPQAELMWHELMVGKWLSVETPSSSEQEALVLRHLQDTANEYLASVSNLTKDEWDEKVRHLEYWARGIEAVEIIGIADGYIAQPLK